MKRTIRLDKGEWQYDDEIQLGKSGGFGAVFEGYSEELEQVAIKRLNTYAEDSARRELKIASYLLNKQYEHIIPIYDSGIDPQTGVTYVVMAKGKNSLANEIVEKKAFQENHVIQILREIVSGLLEAIDIVHRDLKPANVLFHDGKWKIADFGIAKFIEDSTSSMTLSGCLTPQYAAPEQWNNEKVSHETDVYALGCVGCELILGNPPFLGSKEDLKLAHLSQKPPEITSANTYLNMLLMMCLKKNPQNRPSLMRVSELLDLARDQVSKDDDNLKKLSKAAEEVTKKELDIEAQMNVIRIQAEMKSRNVADAITIIKNQFEVLIVQISKAAPNVRISNDHRSISLGEATLTFIENFFQVIYKERFRRSNLDLIIGGMMILKQKNPNYIWSTNLWFGDMDKSGAYRWWECAYMDSPFVLPRRQFAPFAVEDVDDADKAASSAMEVIQYAIYPKMIDDEYQEAFIKRWIILFTHGVKGELRRPARLPIAITNSSDYLT